MYPFNAALSDLAAPQPLHQRSLSPPLLRLFPPLPNEPPSVALCCVRAFGKALHAPVALLSPGRLPDLCTGHRMGCQATHDRRVLRQLWCGHPSLNEALFTAAQREAALGQTFGLVQLLVKWFIATVTFAFKIILLYVVCVYRGLQLQ